MASSRRNLPVPPELYGKGLFTTRRDVYKNNWMRAVYKMSNDINDDMSKVLQLPGAANTANAQLIDMAVPQGQADQIRSSMTVIRANGNMFRISGVEAIS